MRFSIHDPSVAYGSVGCSVVVQGFCRPGACCKEGACTNGQPPPSCGPGLPFSLGHLLQDDLLDGQLGHYPLEPTILLFQLFEPLEGIGFQPSVLALPSLVGRQTDRLAADCLLDPFACRKLFAMARSFLMISSPLCLFRFI